MLLRQNYYGRGGGVSFGLLLFPTFRLPVALAVIGCGRRATLRPLLRLLVLLWRRRLTISALHSFSLAARLTRGSATRRRGDRLAKSGWLHRFQRCSMFSCAQRRRRAEPLTLTSSLVTLRRSSVLPRHARTWLLTWSSRWLSDHVLAAATVHPRKLTAVLLSLLQPGRAREIARLV